MTSVLHVTATDEGGAGRSALRLHEGLRRIGCDSSVIAWRTRSGADGVTSIRNEVEGLVAGPVAAAERLLPILLPRLHLGDMRLPLRSPRALAHTSAFARASVVNLHQLHGNYFDFKLLPQWAAVKPLVWTLHDQWPLTGHCAYSYGCERWLTGCHTCPLYTDERRRFDDIPQGPVDTTAWQWRAKRRVSEQTTMVVVAPSRWLAALAERSTLGGRHGTTVCHIPYGIDTDVYRPELREHARAALGIEPQRPVVVFAAGNLTQGRKGLDYLLSAIAPVAREFPSLLLLLLGPAARLPTLPAESRSFSVSDQALQAVVYAAADVAVSPSLADNQPLVLLEALASGVPAVAFAVGGIPELVRHLENGYLSAPADASDLSRGIATLLRDDQLRRRLGASARAGILERHELEMQAQRYAELYAGLAIPPAGEARAR